MPLVRQAFVLGAGLGTRLRPLTDDLPKPLIPIFQKPLITFAFDHLIDIGIDSFVINTHRLPEAFTEAFPENRYRGRNLTFVNEPDLLETGGGIKNVESHLDGEPFITYSGDVLTDIQLRPLINEHSRRKNDVTLALRETSLGSGVALRDHRVIDISNRYGIAGNYDFANVAIWNPSIFSRLPPRQKISFIPVVADWIGQGGKIGGLVLDDGKWFNIGSRAEYLEVHRTVGRENWQPRYLKERKWCASADPSAVVDASAQLRGCTVVGKACRIGAAAILEDTIVWPGSQIASESELFRCIVRSHKSVTGIHRDVDI